MDNFFYDLGGENERYSFDSDGFDEESNCSWISDPESLFNVWRGWTWKNSKHSLVNQATSNKTNGCVSSLIDLSARAVAANIPFAVVESYPLPIPEDLQLKIAFWSFPDSEEDIRLYSCLANGSPDEFVKGELLYKNNSVKDAIQIGFHLSGVLCPPQTAITPVHLRDGFKTGVVFDRQRITANSCTCEQSAWCQHIVALCLHRVHQANQVKLRAPISESLGRLDRSQLQKFAQYLIQELHDRQVLPTAQRLLDELLSPTPTAINKLDGAPDPTAGPDGDTHAAWYMDQRILHENIKKTLVKFCVPSPVVYSDLNCLSSSAPPAAAEWQSLLRPLRGREPEGIWNLLSIVRELLQRKDSNAVPLLEILTDEMLQCEQLLVWWFVTKISSAHNSVSLSKAGGNNSNSAQNAASSLCEEIVTLWRLVALNPTLSPPQRDDLRSQLETWHIMTLDKVRNAKCNNSSKKGDIELFPGFKPALEATYIDWTDYCIEGITYSEVSYTVYQKASVVPGQTCLTSDSCCAASKVSPITNYKVDDSKYSFAADEASLRLPAAAALQAAAAGGRQDDSSGSEGFCDQEPRRPSRRVHTETERTDRDSDSSDEGIKLNKAAADDDSDLEMPALSTADTSPRVGVVVPAGAQTTSPECSNSPTIHNESFSPNHGSAAAAPISPAAEGAASALDDAVGEDLQTLYQYDASLLRVNLPALTNLDGSIDEPNYFAGIRQLEDKKEILFARAEALYAHGHSKQACELASKLALNMMGEEGEHIAGNTGKRQSQGSLNTNFSQTPPAKAAFMCTVLTDNVNYHHLAFKIGMYGLEIRREPAPSKALEVKIANQESELVNLLKRIPLGDAELSVIREKAEKIRDGLLISRDQAHLPLMLTTLIFECLCLPAQGALSNSAANSRPPSRCVQVNGARLATDEQLGFEAAVAALGMKTNISEADHPLICEGMRIQKGDLAIAMLVHYKDDSYRLDKILEKLLDKDIHSLFKAPPISSYISTGSTSSGRPSAAYSGRDIMSSIGQMTRNLVSLTMDEPRGDNVVRPKANRVSFNRPSQLMDASSSEETTASKLRCYYDGKMKRPSVGMAAVDSSAPETTSSDNSPTVVRRPFTKHTGGGAGSSDSESSGRSSVGSGSSMPRPQRARNTDSPSFKYQYNLEPRNLKNHINFRNKGKAKATPTEPNQPSEALAHFLFELAKTLLQKAGGTSSISMFNQRETNSHHGTHRLLHLCSFQIALYALGINNCVSKNWLSRTYSSHVSWITGQAIEIGTVAINILMDTWEGHLTPTEVASLTDRASRGRDPNMVKAAAELALSCLAHAQALNPQETKRAMLQCKEQSNKMLEQACIAVESAAKDGGVSPEVLFDVARKWCDLHEMQRQVQQNSVVQSQQQVNNSLQPARMSPPTSVPHQRHSQQQLVHSAMSNPNITRPQAISHIPMMVNSLDQSQSPLMAAPANLPPQPMYRTQHPAISQVSQQQPGGGIAGYPQNHTVYVSCYPPSASQQMHPSGFMSAVAYNAASPSTFTQPVTMNQMYHIGVSNGNPVFNTSPQQPAVMAITNSPSLPSMLPLSHPQAAVPNMALMSQHHMQIAATHNTDHTNYILSAFRVGMLALETYGCRIIDDRPQAKYNRNPSCKEDIKWLLNLSMKLGPCYTGPSYLQQFCQMAINSLLSPFVLYDIATEIANTQTRNSPAQFQSIFRTPMLNALMQRCVQMFTQCAHQRIHHIPATDYDEFVSIVSAARKAFGLLPNGMAQFQELLQGLRRNKSCKKELWQRLMSGLSLSS